MLYLSLVPAAILLLAAHAAARPDPLPVRWHRYLAWGALAIVLGLCVFAAPVVARLFGLLAVALGAWRLTRRRVRWFVPYSLAAVLIAYGFNFWWAWQDYSRVVVFRDRYPFESMADRVPEPRRGGPAGEPPGYGETEVEAWRRSNLLQRVHESTVVEFVNRPGFGVGRVVRMQQPTERTLQARPDRPEPPPQPESPGPPWALGGVRFTLPEHDRQEFRSLHAGGLRDFVNPEGWGYVRSRREVAGFLPHAFSRVPASREWTVARVELVGLLKHAGPVVYPSDRLPAMADLADAPTRAPDDFEAAGVEAIRRGEDGFAGRRGDEVRFVGAVRSAAACVRCHGGERGDLLGAFAYRLHPAGR